MSYLACDLIDEKVSIAWNQSTMHGLVVEEMATASFIDTPFCFDMGTTSHISLFKSDSIKICTIEPKEIWGVNGRSILAIGTRIIKVRCGKRRKFTLNHALYPICSKSCAMPQINGQAQR